MRVRLSVSSLNSTMTSVSPTPSANLLSAWSSLACCFFWGPLPFAGPAETEAETTAKETARKAVRAVRLPHTAFVLILPAIDDGNFIRPIIEQYTGHK